MENRVPAFYLILGLCLLFLIPVAESVEHNLGLTANFLVIGYWVLLGISFVIPIVKKFFTQFSIRNLLYNLWLFLSLMCVAIGALAIVDDGIDKAHWAVGLILYGGTVGFLNRKEL